MPLLTRTLVLIIAMLLLLTACADQNTAVGAGGADDPSEADDTPIPVEPDGGIGDSSVPASDTPIPVEPDGGIGGETPAPTGEAPAFGVSSETDSLAAEPFTYCWSDAGGGVCADGFPQPDLHPITAADQLVVTYEEGTLQAFASPAGTLGAGPGSPPPSDPAERQELPVTVENPGINLVDVSGLAPGTYDLELSWTGDQGDAFTALSLTIERS